MAWVSIYLDVLKRYAEFDGRATRTEYWVFALISAIISIVLTAIGFVSGVQQAFADIYAVAVFLPYIAVGARRLHDTNRSGWWQIVPIVNLIFLSQRTRPGENGFGENAKGGEADSRLTTAEKFIFPVGRSGWAIAAGYLALFSVLVVPAPAALFCGAMALRDISNNPEKIGKPRAYFGIVMGIIGTAVLLLMIFRQRQ